MDEFTTKDQLGLTGGRVRRTVPSVVEDLRGRRDLEREKLTELQSEVDDLRARIELFNEIILDLES